MGQPGAAYAKGAKYQWLLPTIDVGVVHALSARYNFVIPLMQTLVRRGFDTPEKIDAFLFTDAQRDIAPSLLLQDAAKAVERICLAIERKEKILIVGDYDVDGITATSLLLYCLKEIGASVNYFLPHRVNDGYGLSSSIIKRAAANHYHLVITVDNGITAIEPVEYATQAGIDVIITDHHRPHAVLPAAYAVVNPARSDCAYPYKELAGVGVTFKLVSLLYERLNWPLPEKAYELLLLGTIADVVPLTGENRYWVRYCLGRVNESASQAFQVLKNNGGLAQKPAIGSIDIAFSLAPQLNALGRLQDPRQGVQFLIDSRAETVDKVGRLLFELNEARKNIERSIMAEIMWAIDQKQIDVANESVIVAASTQWPVGVIGLVASRLVAEFGKPVVLFHVAENGLAKGSGRSIAAFDLFAALQELAFMFEHFGGHAQAAGICLKAELLPRFKDALADLVRKRLTPSDLQQKIVLDATLPLNEINETFVRHLHFLEPFGHANEAPIFHISDVALLEQPSLLKGLHVKCRVTAGGAVKSIIFFNRPELFELLRLCADRPFAVAVQVTENYWQGNKTIELRGVDIAVPGDI